jgi:hypothetical protein
MWVALPRAPAVHPAEHSSTNIEADVMSTELKIGDRVRVTPLRPVHGYQPGCRGIVRSGPRSDSSGKIYYGVRMDKDDANDATLFLADEIELVT